MLDDSKRSIWRSWYQNICNDLVGPRGYRTWFLIVSTAIGVHFAFYAHVVARHERMMSRAFVERSAFVTMVTSGGSSDFVTAMKDFGPVQTVSVLSEPQLWKPLKWRETDQPNMKPLHRWADIRLSACEKKREGECGDNPKYRVDLHKANFQGADLHKTDLSQSLLAGAELTNANLSGAKLTKANLSEADLTDANLSGAKLTKANLSEADLTDANLSHAVLRDGNLSGAKLTNADLSSAVLRDGNLIDAKLTKANLSEADLTDANLSHAVLRDANLSGAKLTNADLSSAVLRDAKLKDADLSSAVLGGADLGGANLRKIRYWTPSVLSHK